MFGEFNLLSVSPLNEAQKKKKKLKNGGKSEQNSGQKFEHFGELAFWGEYRSKIRGKNSNISGSFRSATFNTDTKVDTEYNRAKVPQHNGKGPRPPLIVSKAFCFNLYSTTGKKKYTPLI